MSAEMGKELVDRRGVASPQLPAAPPIMHELVYKLVVQLGEYPPTTRHPLIEVSEKGQMRASRRSGIPALGEMIRKRVKMRAQNSRSQALKQVAVFDELIQHVSSVSRLKGRRGENSRIMSGAQVPKSVVPCKKGSFMLEARHNPEPGMLPLMPHAA